MAGIIGNDLSVHQLFEDYDKYNSVSAFSFIRLMNGKDMDGRFVDHWTNITGRKAPYLHLKWWLNIADQINTFYNAVMQYAPDFTLPPVIDVENLMLTQNQITQAFELAKNMFGNYPIPYSSKYFWPKYYPDYTGVPNWAANYPYSLQNVRRDGLEAKIMDARNDGFPNMPTDWGEFMPKEDVWQCSSSGYGPDWGLKWPDSKEIDINWFEGTLADLDYQFALWKGNVVPPPTVNPKLVVPIATGVVKATNGLNTRELPDASTADLGTLRYLTEVPLVEQDGDWWRIDGWVHGDYIDE